MNDLLIYGNHFDGRVHVDFDKQSTAGIKYAGPLQLLAELELRTAMTGIEVDNSERTGWYLIAMKKYLATNTSSILKASFDLDPESMAEVMLRRRDAMVMAGMNTIKFASDNAMVKEILAIEPYFAAEMTTHLGLGVADRWVALLDNIANTTKAGQLSNLEIQVTEEKSSLHPTIVAVLDALAQMEVSVTYLQPAPVEDQTIKVYEFEDVHDCYSAAAVQVNPDTDVLIAQQGQTLCDYLLQHGKQQSGYNYDLSLSTEAQLLRVFLLMLAEPNNIYNIIAYLSVPFGVVEHGSKLARYLLKTGGWGNADEWKEFCDSLKECFKDDKGQPDSKKHGEVVTGFNAIKNLLNKGTAFTVNEVRQRVKELMEWAKKHSHFPAAKALRDNCRIFLRLCPEDTTGKAVLTVDKLKHYVKILSKNESSASNPAILGSADLYTSLGAVYSPVSEGKVIWADCYGYPSAAYDYSYLSNAEMVTLKSAGLRIWSKAEQMAAQVCSLKTYAQRCGKELWLFVPKKANGQQVIESPLLVSLGLKAVSAAVSQSLLPAPMTPQPLAVGKADVILPNAITSHRMPKKGASKAEESFSSLNLMQECPQDYTLKYLANLYAPEVIDTEHLASIKGTVAHRTLENLVNSNDGDVAKMLKKLTSLNQYIEEAAKECGLVLFLKENKLEFDRLKNDLSVSIPQLLKIIRDNGLTIVGMEQEYRDANSGVTGGNADLTAKVDLVLTNNADQYYIFDLKYAKPEDYKEGLRKNKEKANQLHIYKLCMEQQTRKKVVFQGFFMLKDGKLLTANNNIQTVTGATVINLSSRAEKDPIRALTDMYGAFYTDLGNKQIKYKNAEYSDYRTLKDELK